MHVITISITFLFLCENIRCDESLPVGIRYLKLNEQVILVPDAIVDVL